MKRPSAKRLFIQEVAPRDGFQAETIQIPTHQKIDLINELSRTGVAKIEVTSFTSPKAIPSLADAEQVMRGIDRLAGVEYSALVPNVRGEEPCFALSTNAISSCRRVRATTSPTCG